MSHLDVVLLITAYFSMATAVIKFILASRELIAGPSQRP